MNNVFFHTVCRREKSLRFPEGFFPFVRNDTGNMFEYQTGLDGLNGLNSL